MFSVSLYTVALVLHVAGGSVLIGLVVIGPLVRRSIRAAETLATLRQWLDFMGRAEKMALPSALVLLLTGVYLGSFGWWTQPWFYVASVAWAANSALATLVMRPSAERLHENIANRDGAVDAPADALRRSRPWDLALQLARANDVSMLYVMFAKPGLVECLIVIGGAALISIAIGAWQTADRRLTSVPATSTRTSP